MKWSLKSKFLSFITKVNLNNENETKSDISPWGIFKSDCISFSLSKYSSISMTFKIGISQFYDKSEPMQWKWNKMGHIQIWHLLLSKLIKVFQWISKSKFLNFITKVNPSNGNETKSHVFPRDIFKSDIIYISGKNTKMFQWLL